MIGAIRFCRYGYPPNSLGYCGPDETVMIREYVAAGVADPELARLARGFEGAWPYLELIASANGIRDPLDERVVEAYWVGGPLLDSVDEGPLGHHLEERFRSRMGRRWWALSEVSLAGSVPHHNFHVFVVYPWIGMLRSGLTEEPLHVLDRCRVRWGVVQNVEATRATVRSQPLIYDGSTLGLGEPRVEEATTFGDDLRPGDSVSLHWDHVCEPLGARGVASLERETARALGAANEVLRRPAAPALA